MTLGVVEATKPRIAPCAPIYSSSRALSTTPLAAERSKIPGSTSLVALVPLAVPVSRPARLGQVGHDSPLVNHFDLAVPLPPLLLPLLLPLLAVRAALLEFPAVFRYLLAPCLPRFAMLAVLLAYPLASQLPSSPS